MPYEWKTTETEATLRVWPYRSLPARGFVWFIGTTAVMLALPLLAVIGTAVLWGLLPFVVIAVAGVWYALRRNDRDREMSEVLTISRDVITLVRTNARTPPQGWSANPYWVQVHLHPTGGPVEEYLTLKGEDREVELGAFLGPEERIALAAEVKDQLRRLR